MRIEDKLIGAGFETVEELKEYIKQEGERELVSVSDIYEPNEPTEDEYFTIGFYDRVITCWIARGKSGRFYTVETSTSYDR